MLISASFDPSVSTPQRTIVGIGLLVVSIARLSRLHPVGRRV
jgi:hypothetical protein